MKIEGEEIKLPIESDSEGDITGGFKSGDSQVLSRSGNMIPLEEKGSQ